MTETAAQFKGNFLEGLAGILRRTAKPDAAGAPSAQTFENSARELNSAIENLKSAIKKQRDAAAEKLNAANVKTPGRSAQTGPSPLEIQQRELESALGRMRADILELHTQLKTGISDQTLSGLETFFADLAKQIKGRDLDSRIRNAIAERVFHEIGPASWNVMMHFMEKSGVKWPEPDGLMRSADPAERTKAVEHRMGEAESLFLSQNLEAGVGSMIGMVTAWKRYPDQESWLWGEVVIRGVASGIRCVLMRSAVEKLRSESEELRTKANELLTETMAAIQTLLDNGVRSVDEAEKVVRGTDAVVQEVLPDLAWQRVKVSIEGEVHKIGNLR